MRHCAALQLQVITEITRFLKSTPFPSNCCHYSALWMLDGCAIGANWEGKEGKGCIVLDLIWHDDDNVPDADDARYDTYRQVLDVVCGACASAAADGALVELPFDGPRHRTPRQLWLGE